MTANFSRIEARLQNFHRNGKGWTARCPAHDDTHNSLSVGEGNDGRILLHCHAGCAPEAIVGKLGLTMADLMPPREATPAPKKQIKCIYDYRDENGTLLSQAVRHEPKGFAQRRPDGRGGWIWNMEGVRRVPYRLPELLAAPPDAYVFVVEGEKDVENLHALGLTATCNAGGAGKWTSDHAQHLAGRKVIIIPDNDEAGRKHGQIVGESLQGIAAEVRWLELPGVAAKGDVSDWLGFGGTKQHLMALADEAPHWEPEEQAQTSSTKPGDEDFLFTAGHHDEGNAVCVYRLYGDRFRYCPALGWLSYNDRFWDGSKGESAVKEAVVDTLLRRSHAALDKGDMTLIQVAKPSATRTRDALYMLTPKLEVSVSEFDNEPHLLNVANGVLDLRTGDLVAHERSNRFTYCIPVDYDTGAWDAGLYHRLMLEWMGGDIERVAYTQRALGYSTTGETREECMLFVEGPGRGGKGTMINTPKDLLGDQLAKGIAFSAFTDSRNDPQNFRLAPLRSCRVVIASESSQQHRLNEAIVKQITGRDTLQVAHKHKPPFDLTPQFKLWLMSNYSPRGDTNDDAFWWRVRLIRLTKSYMENPDLTLKDRLREPAEQRALLSWLVYGAIRWYAVGLGRPEWLRADVEKVRNEQDPVRRFAEEVIVRTPGKATDMRIVHDVYTQWCADEGIEGMAKNVLSGKLSAQGFSVQHKSERTTDGPRKRSYIENVELAAGV